MTTRAADALTCQRGCDACCVDGLSVLPVEAALIEAHCASPPRKQRDGMCAPPRGDEVLDATKLMMLLVTVDRRYRARIGMDDDTSRVLLRDVADTLRPTSTFKRQV